MCVQKKIPAFTIIEVIISMVVTAIIISIVFTLFVILSGQLTDFKKANEITADLNRLKYCLSRDAFNSETIEVNDDVLKFGKYNGEKLMYRIQDTLCIKYEKAFIDTFKLKLIMPELERLENKKNGITYLRLTCKVILAENPVKLRFYKKVHMNDLIKDIRHEF